MRSLDFSSWQSLLVTILGLTLVTLVGVGIRLLTQMTFQQRRERMNRQINTSASARSSRPTRSLVDRLPGI